MGSELGLVLRVALGLGLVTLEACAQQARPAEHTRSTEAAQPAPPPVNGAHVPHERDREAAVRKSPHVLLGLPSDADPSDDFLLDKGAFVVSYNRTRNQPNWVAWRLTADDLGREGRSENFRQDQDLPSSFHRVKANDYKGSGYDRGHLCPSSHRTRDGGMNSLTFLMTNMQPQLHSLNAGPWKSLETYERDVAAKEGKDVYVVAGALFDARPATIGREVAVPRAAYRVTVVLPHGAGLDDVDASTRTYAVEMPNDASVQGRKWGAFLTSVDAVERDSGYDFLAALPDDKETHLEARAP